MNRRSLALTLVTTVAGVGFGAAVAVPAAADWYQNRHEESAAYASGAEAKRERGTVPGWLPDGAREVRYAMRTTGGDRLIRATLPGGALPEGCRAVPDATTGAAPSLKAGWFPEDARGRATVRCGAYYAYLDGDTLYGWQHHADWVTENRTRAAG
ncbi:hypothetical protein [Streptomyces sp. NPDC101132]|uniref:hypothetical protein n=1 Tax=Streptomyces sp. NPDC101132 TaxID=3366110 RepID=UPI0038014C8D